MNKIFEGYKVLELSSVLAGPAVGMFFAELGAEVIKIENSRTNGDVTRTWRLSSEDSTGVSAYYASVNYNKKVILLDLSSKEGQSKVYDIAASCDIVITNYKKGAAEKLKMDYETLRSFNKEIIYAHLTGFGLASDRPAFDVVLQAEAGFMFMSGTPGREPVKMPVALVDVLAAHQLKEGILIALIKKMKTGKGSFVTASLYDSAVSSLVNQATNWLMAKHIPQAMGSQHPNIAPYGDIFLTKENKKVVIACGTQKHFVNLCLYFNLEHLIEDDRYCNNTNRVMNRAALNTILETAFSKKNRTVLIKELTQMQVPIGAIRNMQEVFEDEASQALILEEIQGKTLTKRVKSVVFKLK